MIHIVTLNPAIDLMLALEDPTSGKIGKVLKTRLEAGGKGVNILRFLLKWGVKADLSLGTGGGKHPSHLLYQALLKEEKIPARFLSDDAPVRFNVVLEKEGKASKYNHPGFDLGEGMFFKLLPAVRRDDLLVLTGRLPGEEKDSLYADWIKVFGKRGVRTALDTSGEPLKAALKAKPWFLKVNLQELSEALGKKFASLEALSKALTGLRRMGLAHGAVTHGDQGALLWREGEALLVRLAPVKALPLVVGSGDAFLAGYLKGSEEGESFADCARLACAAGAVVAECGIGGFESGKVEEMVKRVKVEKVKS